MSYVLLKTLHIISSTLLFGTGLGSAFYYFRAQQSKDIASLYFASKNVVLADWLFTTPAVIIQPITGYWLMSIDHYDFSMWWLQLAIALYIFTGICWLPVVYLQIKMHQLIKEAYDAQQSLPEIYYRYQRWWFILGWPAFISVIIIFYLMVAKPM